MIAKCELCCEAKLEVGDKTAYGSTIVHKFGEKNNGWFATLSPRTGGDPEKDFTVQLMPISHLRHISEISKKIELAKNYGVAFSKIARAVTQIMKEENRDKENEESVARVGIYGKSKHPDEHFHVKLFPWCGRIGQPYTVDSSFERSQVYFDKETGEGYVKMKPVRKVKIAETRYSYLTNKLISSLR